MTKPTKRRFTEYEREMYEMALRIRTGTAWTLLAVAVVLAIGLIFALRECP